MEASLTVPLFLFCIYLFWLLFTVVTLQVKIARAAEDVTGQLAQQAAVVEAWKTGDGAVGGTDGGDENGGTGGGLAGALTGGLTSGDLLTDVAWKSWALSQVVSKVGREELNSSVILGGAAGIVDLGSTWHLDGDLDLRLDYVVSFPALLGLRWTLPLTQHSIRRSWTGSQTREAAADGEAEELVYITADGAVYHRDVSCYHLNLTVRQVSTATVSGQRNEDGDRYYPCERCAASGAAGSKVYIAREGNRYHNTRDCAGLKRTVQSVPLSQVGGRRPCSNCG